MKLSTYLLLFLNVTFSTTCFAQEENSNSCKTQFTRNHTKNKNNLLFVPLQIQTKTHYLPFSFWNKKNSLGFDFRSCLCELGAGGTSSISGLFKGKFHRCILEVIVVQ
jgi:hypothetical protein